MTPGRSSTAQQEAADATASTHPAASRRRALAVVALAVALAAAVGALLALVLDREPERGGASVASAPRDGAPLPPGAPDLVWTADAESPIADEWASYATADLCTARTATEVTSSRFTRVSDPRAQGAFAYRSLAQDGDICFKGERAEISQGNPTKDSLGDRLFHDGQERWIAWQLRLGRTFPLGVDTWQVVMQLKQLGGLGPPALAMEIQGGRWRLAASSNTGGRRSGGSLWVSRAAARRDQWVRFALRVHFSPDRSRGFVELYGDLADGAGYRHLLGRTRTSTMKVDPGTGEAVSSHTRLGIYRNPKISGTTEAWYDGYTVATTRAAAEANAY